MFGFHRQRVYVAVRLKHPHTRGVSAAVGAKRAALNIQSVAAASPAVVLRVVDQILAGFVRVRFTQDLIAQSIVQTERVQHRQRRDVAWIQYCEDAANRSEKTLLDHGLAVFGGAGGFARGLEFSIPRKAEAKHPAGFATERKERSIEGGQSIARQRLEQRFRAQ